MATIQPRKNKRGTTYQVLIRTQDGHPPTYRNFPTKQEAKDWAKQEEARRRQETYFPEQAKKKHTLVQIDKSF
jgi:hypothetical protein